MAATSDRSPDTTNDKPPRRKRKMLVSVRMFAAILLIVGLGGSLWFGLAVHRQRTAIHEIERLGGECEIMPIGPNLKDRFVRRFIPKVTKVRLDGVENLEEITPYFRRLNPRPRLYVSGTQVHELVLHSDADSVILLLNQYPVLIYACDRSGMTPLHVAARAGEADIVQLLLKRGAPTNDQDDSRNTPLHLTDDECVVKAILKKHPDLTKPGWSGTPLQFAAFQFDKMKNPRDRDKWRRIANLYLHHGAEYDLLSAIYLNDLDQVQGILKRSPKKAHDFRGQSPLRIAARLGRYEICRYLVETHHVDVNDFEGTMRFPIIIECLAHKPIVQLLIDNGVDVKTPINCQVVGKGCFLISEKATTLHCAAEQWSVPETISLLIDNGADIFALDRDVSEEERKLTALECAAIFANSENARAIVNHPKFAAADQKITKPLLDKCLWRGARWQRAQLIEVFLEKGANPNFARGGKTVVQVAATCFDPDNDQEVDLNARDAVALLEQYGARIDLTSAVAIGDTARVTQFLETDGALANSLDPDGYSALHIAVKINSTAIVASLLNAGACIEIRGPRRGYTPLHCTALWGRAEIAKLLIEAGADVNSRDDFGNLPLDTAEDSLFEDVAKLLRDHGARNRSE